MSHVSYNALDGDIDLDALQRVDPRLVALALGRIDDGELAELLERALHEPTVHALVEAIWPEDDATLRARWAEAERQRGDRGPQRPHWSLMFLPTGIAVSAVTSVCVMLMSAMQAPALPAYGLEVGGGIRMYRSSRPGPKAGRWTPKAPLELVYRPHAPVEGEARAALFRMGMDGPERLNAVAEVSESGSVRWRGRVDTLFPDERGPVELLIAVRSGNEPPTAQDVRLAFAGDRPSVRVAKTILVIEDR